MNQIWRWGSVHNWETLAGEKIDEKSIAKKISSERASQRLIVAHDANVNICTSIPYNEISVRDSVREFKVLLLHKIWLSRTNNIYLSVKWIDERRNAMSPNGNGDPSSESI